MSQRDDGGACRVCNRSALAHPSGACRSCRRGKPIAWIAKRKPDAKETPILTEAERASDHGGWRERPKTDAATGPSTPGAGSWRARSREQWRRREG